MFLKKGVTTILVIMMMTLATGCASSNNKANGTDSTENNKNAINTTENSKNAVNNSGDVAATVNGVNINKSLYQANVDRMVSVYQQQGLDFKSEQGAAFLKQINQSVINNLVQEEVLKQEAEKNGYEVSDKELSDEYSKMKEQFNTEEEFQAALETTGFTEEELKTSLSNQIKISHFLDDQVEEAVVSDEEIQKAYDEYKSTIEQQTAESEKKPEIPTLEEMKEQLKSQIKQQKEQEQVQTIINDLMDKSDIQILV